ncbi:cuticle protein 16.5-like [Amyelois transitella]|uniref:cuticle protein 16.5-like n=1 Tax=Amyelois transitella TaxID=680683 RepID=UPI00298FD32D|nr:cuticle protein 16.5-like [Amyelois transitella]
MTSLVVLFSVMALTAAKPSGLLHAGLISYAAPAITSYAAPAAVSEQSRIDIKSSPAVVATAAVAPVTRTFISEPIAVAAPTVVAAPAAAVSHQSRVEVKSAPAVINTVATAPIAYSAPIATAAVAPALSGAIASPAFAPTAFVNTAYGAPAFVKSAEFIAAESASTPSVPQDTPEVIAARNAHFKAKALATGHLIRKRSAPFFGAPIVSAYSTPFVSSLVATHPVSSYSVPLVSAPLITKTYGLRAW